MKRYRITNFDFDTRAYVLSVKIEDHWDEQAKLMWTKNHEDIRNGLGFSFGLMDYAQKEKNFLDLGAKQLSVVAFHNVFFEQIRVSFVTGAYYPALTATCALGERVLNHLILKFRDSFKGSDEYKRVYKKDSFDDWSVPIDVLEKWKILLPDSAQEFRALRKVRNDSIHFRPELDTNDRDPALKAIGHFQNILKLQFSAFGALPWFFIVPGENYIKQEWEKDPFVKAIYLPNCQLVSPYHRVMSGIPFQIQDRDGLENTDISDEEFGKLRATFLSQPPGVPRI